VLISSQSHVCSFTLSDTCTDVSRIRTKAGVDANKENIPPGKPGRLSVNSPAALDRLIKPFKCPGAFNSRKKNGKPPRKRRKVNYKEDGAGADDESGGFILNEDSVALKDRFPVFKVKDKDAVFRAVFSVPLVNKSAFGASRQAPSLGMRRGLPFVNKPLHDPSGEFAIVLYDPTIDEKPGPDAAEKPKEEEKPKLDEPLMHKSLNEILGIRKEVEGERPNVPVVIDPRLAKVLRPHQVEGVKFLYRCTTGMIDEKAKGCIMADEMGLGKTLQCIALMYTLLKQSPVAGKGTISKCVIACPASLVKNWANELVKWLGEGTIHPFAIDGKATKEELTRQLQQWAIASGRQVTRPVLIVSYESLRLNIEELKDVKIGLMLCDEGHRLKNSDSNTYTALTGLNVDRRVILSGTPIQNDLTEYYSLLDFANPGYLGTRADFRKKFELPILRGRDAAGSDVIRQKGEAATAELGAMVNKLIIRRTNDILSKYLPIKYEHVVFCNLAPFQMDLYNHFIQSPDIKSLVKGKGSQPLKAIGILKKLCNHPDLLDLESDLPGSEHCWPEDYTPKEARGRDRDVKTWWSGKFQVLERMLARIRQDTNDKIVLISNYTQTLDVLEKLCRARSYGCLRLDGTMNVNKRQKLVDKFNDPNGEEFVFLLSSKAGGCGINLIGANRLILFDPDWNPAADQQALARVWRDGQKKDCFVYRFMGTGTIEEKIFQRQSHKQALSSTIVDSAEDVERHFTLESLRELFQFKLDTRSDTHDTFKCKRCKPGGDQIIKAPAMLYGDTSSWNHFVNNGEKGPLGKIQDLLLRQEASETSVSAVFQYISH
jgi:DNA repair and recombination protein RAD54 and RAD54-like protein